MSAKVYKILQGSFRDSDGSTKGYGEEIVVPDDQAGRFVGQLEYVRDVPADDAAAAAAAGSADHASE